MDREQFLKELFLMYPSCFNEYNVTIWRRKYELMLSPKIDYDGLEIKFASSWKDMRVPPSPPELKELARDYLTTTYTPNYSTAKACPPPPDFMEKVNSLRNKLSMEQVL